MKRKTAVFGILLILITACATPMQPADQSEMEAERPFISSLPDLGEAPELLNEVWVNSDEPVTLADSRGKVVLLEFWTFG